MFEGFFKNRAKQISKLNRNAITDESQIEEILLLSVHKPVLIFKHSTRCGASSIILRRFESKMADKIEGYNYFFLDILKYRNVSNSIANRFHIAQESPQLLLIKNKEIIFHNSHYRIMDLKL
jgi:bacillithiol system protein YtxJ